MADVWNPETREYIRSVDRSEYGDPWVAIGKGAYPIDQLPACDPSLWELVDNVIVEGTPVIVPEPILVRHAREQQEGVELQNGWKIKYGKTDRDELGALKNTIDLVGAELEQLGQMVPIFEANGTVHLLPPSEMLLILKEYTLLALIEYSRQANELNQA